MHRNQALALHELAHDIATGTRPITGIRWYTPDAQTGLAPTPVLPAAVHRALCPSRAVVLDDPDAAIHICDECELAIEDET